MTASLEGPGCSRKPHDVTFNICLNEAGQALLTSLVTLFIHLADAHACFLLSSYHTSVCSIELNAKVSIRSTAVVAGSEDDATDGFVFPDYAGNGGCGHHPVVSNDHTTHLRKCHAGLCVCELVGMRVYLNLSGEARGQNSAGYQVWCFMLLAKVSATFISSTTVIAHQEQVILCVRVI